MLNKIHKKMTNNLKKRLDLYNFKLQLRKKNIFKKIKVK